MKNATSLPEQEFEEALVNLLRGYGSLLDRTDESMHTWALTILDDWIQSSQ